MNYDDLTDPTSFRAIIIAEAGINHDGDIKKAIKMIDAAVLAGADYVKFQTFNANKLVTPDALTSSYIDKGSKHGESFRDLLKRLEINKDHHYQLKKYCDESGIKFLSTAFDYESFDFLVSLGIDAVKVASGDITNLPLLRHMARANLPMILSTGMATLGEIEEAINVIVDENNNNIILLHCISWYPAEIHTTNLRFMETLRSAFPYPIGYSDHTLGINMSVASRAFNAVIIEKHFTLDSSAFGPDHSASIEPNELAVLVNGIREVELGMGSTQRVFSQHEIRQRLVHRKSIVVKDYIRSGDTISADNVAIKRPGTGIKPKHLDDIIGRKVLVDCSPETVLKWEHLVER